MLVEMAHDHKWRIHASNGEQLAAYFFPVIFTMPLFGRYLAQEWLWTFTPSLSYIGQGATDSCPVRSTFTRF
jgi:hypothetical protein